MTFQVYKGQDKKKIAIVGTTIVTILFAGFFLYCTFSFYEESSRFDVINGRVAEQNYDTLLVFTIEDENGNKTYSESMPEGRGWDVTIICNNGATGTWNYEAWGPLIMNVNQSQTKCSIHFVKRYRDEILNGADPVLKDGLIAVNIAEDGSVKKASLVSEWYNYSSQKWANAVILVDNTKEYADDEVIPEENIESYFVWIPRYRYKIFNEGNYEGLTTIENRIQTIEVEFQTKDVSVNNGSKVGEWLTHPAFTSFDVNGIWVGKFETGYKGANSAAGAQSNTNDSSKVEIKPNVYSWRNIQVANAHLNSYNYKREMDSHMMKNTEWGAVAYLQHSAYGSQSNVRINNNSAYITGYSAVNEPTCGYTETNEECNKYESTSLGVDGTYTINYFNRKSVVASTTGNKSGVYDMSGGAWEYVMGVMLDEKNSIVSGRNELHNSGFNGIYTCRYCDTENDSSKTSLTSGIDYPESKYYDIYAYATNDETYQRRILGDATGEMGPFTNVIYEKRTRQIASWYADEAWFTGLGNPWFTRGGVCVYGMDSGVFAFANYFGSTHVWLGFRIVLAI